MKNQTVWIGLAVILAVQILADTIVIWLGWR